MNTTTDILIIGGGPAGLQAALTVGRVHRNAILLDDGTYRNAPVAHMHNVLANDGTPPADFRKQGREELAAYPTVRVLDARAEVLAGDAATGFVAALADGREIHARRVILATGVRDELPDVPGLAELWGGRAAQCPFCHAHEFAGTRYGILGTARAQHYAQLLGPIAGDLLVLPLPGEPTPGEEPTEIPGARIAAAPVSRLREDSDGVEIEFADGGTAHVAVIFTGATFHQSAPFAAQLGLTLNESGCIRINIFGRTSLDGVFAAGDLAHHPELPMPMPSVINALAAGQTAASAAIASLL